MSDPTHERRFRHEPRPDKSTSTGTQGIMELVLLHALPFDGSMWDRQRDLLPITSHAPTLYDLGNTLPEWATAVLQQVRGDRLIVVGNSIGGSCALEMAALAPERIAALVLIGTKAAHRPDASLHATALSTLSGQGVEAAWNSYWAPLFSTSASPKLLAHAMGLATAIDARTIARGVTAFHTRPGREMLVPTLRCPIVCVSGEHDVAPGRRTSQTQANSAKDGRLIVVPDCGHYVPLEQPGQMNAVLRSLVHELMSPPGSVPT